MPHYKHINLLRAAQVVVLPLLAAVTPGTARAACIEAPAAFELCDLAGLSETTPAPEEGVLVVQLGDFWLDISTLPADFDGMSNQEILDFAITHDAENGSGESVELSRETVTTDEVSAVMAVIELREDGDSSTEAMGVAAHDGGRIFLGLHGGGPESADRLRHSMANVLAALQPRKVN